MLPHFTKVWKLNEKMKLLPETDVENAVQEIIQENSKQKNCQMIFSSMNGRRKHGDGLEIFAEIVDKYHRKLIKKRESDIEMKDNDNDIEMKDNDIKRKCSPFETAGIFDLILAHLNATELLTTKATCCAWVIPCLKALETSGFWLLNINAKWDQQSTKQSWHHIRYLYVMHMLGFKDNFEAAVGTLKLKQLVFHGYPVQDIKKYLGTKIQYEFLALRYWGQEIDPFCREIAHLLWSEEKDWFKGIMIYDCVFLNMYHFYLMKMESLHVVINDDHPSVTTYLAKRESCNKNNNTWNQKIWEIDFEGKELCLTLELGTDDRWNNENGKIGDKYMALFEAIKFNNNLMRLHVDITDTVEALNTELFLLVEMLKRSAEYLTFLQIHFRCKDAWKSKDHWHEKGPMPGINALLNYVQFWHSKPIRLEIQMSGSSWSKKMSKEISCAAHNYSGISYIMWSDTDKRRLVQASNCCLSCCWSSYMKFNNHDWHYQCLNQCYLTIDNLEMQNYSFCDDCETKLDNIIPQ